MTPLYFCACWASARLLFTHTGVREHMHVRTHRQTETPPFSKVVSNEKLRFWLISNWGKQKYVLSSIYDAEWAGNSFDSMRTVCCPSFVGHLRQWMPRFYANNLWISWQRKFAATQKCWLFLFMSQKKLFYFLLSTMIPSLQILKLRLINMNQISARIWSRC